jgi:hypothetical protein
MASAGGRGRPCQATQMELSRTAAIVYQRKAEDPMNQLIYLVGLIVVILAILSFFGLR